MPNLTQRYGFPFSGVRFVTARQLARRDQMVGDATTFSHDFLVDPLEGRIFRRGGSEIVGSNTGLLETVVANSAPRGIQILPFDSPSIDDGYPTHLVVFLDEAKAFGWLYWRNTNGGGADLNLGETFGSFHYPTNTTDAAHWICIPLAYRRTTAGITSGAIGMTRGVTEFLRRVMVAGSRRSVMVGTQLFWGGYDSTPGRWNREFNDASGSGTKIERVSPTGLIPPLFPPRCVTADLPTASTAAKPWKENDQFFLSLIFINQDGQASAPYLPSSTAFANQAGEYANYLGLVTVPSTTGNPDYYEYLRYTNVARGPGGTRARLMLRSPKVDSTVAGAFPNHLDLRVCGIINDNTTTTFDDYLGNDLSLVEAPELVRLDRKWPDRARCLFTFDQRVCAINLRSPAAAIIIAPRGVTNHGDVNPADTDGPVGSKLFTVTVSNGQCNLRYYTASPGAKSEQSISLGSTVSLKKLVDTINQTTAASAAKMWAAQLVPGVDDKITTDSLGGSIVGVSCTTTVGSATLAAGAASHFKDVTIGSFITHLNVPAGTTVVSIESDTSLTMSAGASGSGNDPSATFGQNCGDDAIDNADFKGNVRAGGNSCPAVFYFSRTYLESLRDAKRDLIFTAGGPLDAPYAGNAYVSGNRRPVPADAGIGMGGAPLLNGAVTCYSRAIGRLANIRGGKTGEDADYRNEIFSWGRGSISPYSIVSGNGWVGFLTDQGFVVTDGQTERVISLDCYNPTRKEGFWAYEIGKCKDAAETDGSDYQFHALNADGKIFVSFRRASAIPDIPSHVMVYDYSGSVQASGLAQVLRPDGMPWGWSSVLGYNWRAYSATSGRVGALGMVRKSGATHLLTCDDSNDKTTCGLVQRIENGTWTDGSDRVQAEAYLVTDLHDSLEDKSAEMLRALYYAPGAAEQVKLYRLLSRATAATFALTATAGVPYKRAVMPVPLGQRSLTGQTELLLQALGGAGSTDVHYFGAELDLTVSKAGRSFGG